MRFLPWFKYISPLIVVRAWLYRTRRSRWRLSRWTGGCWEMLGLWIEYTLILVESKIGLKQCIDVSGCSWICEKDSVVIYSCIRPAFMLSPMLQKWPFWRLWAGFESNYLHIFWALWWAGKLLPIFYLLHKTGNLRFPGRHSFTKNSRIISHSQMQTCTKQDEATNVYFEPASHFVCSLLRPKGPFRIRCSFCLFGAAATTFQP